MKRTVLSTGLALILFAASACRGGGGNTAQPAADTGNINIGVFADFSGGTSAAGQATKNGAQLAADEINNAGGIGGRKVELVFEDDRGAADGAESAASRLLASRVRAIVGGTSPGALAAASKAQQAGVPLVTTSATEPNVTGAGAYVFRVCVPDSFQGEAMAKYAARNLHAKTAAILSESNSDYSDALARAFEENFTKLGGQVTQKLNYAPTDADFRTQLTAIRDANAEALYVPGRYSEVGRVAKQARDLGVKATLLGGDAWNDPRLFASGTDALDGSYTTGAFSADDPDPQVRRFASDYASRYGGAPPASAALAYDATKLLADAVARAGTTDGARLRDAIAQTSGYKGVTGALSFNQERNVAKPTVVFKIQGGKFYPVFRGEL
ncbi:MAG: ABC transporter substrate-binding protein [Pyrinomonadaceae bacterium]